MKKQQLTEVLKGAQWNHVGRISQLRERVKGWVRDPDERRWIRRGKDQPWQEDELQRLRLSVASLPPAHSGSLSSLSLSSLLPPPSSLFLDPLSPFPNCLPSPLLTYPQWKTKRNCGRRYQRTLGAETRNNVRHNGSTSRG